MYIPSQKVFYPFLTCCKLAFTITNILKNFIKRGKDKLLSNQNVYKISCDDCNADDCELCYVGQTKRKLSTRLREHISDTNKKTDSSLLYPIIMLILIIISDEMM